MSKRFVGIGMAAVLTAAGFSFVQGLPHAGAAPTTRAAKLDKPYSELKDLSEEQITKIKSIHEAFLTERHKLEAKEKEDIAVLLNDDQKKELETVIAEDKATEKKKAAERRAAAAAEEASTKPSK